MKVQNYRNKLVRKAALLIAILLPSALSAQSGGIPRMENGKPDMQGTWDFRTITPFQRPEALGEKEYLTAEEFAAFEEEERERREEPPPPMLKAREGIRASMSQREQTVRRTITVRPRSLWTGT